MNPLLEKWDGLLKAEGKKAPIVKDMEAMAQILENQEGYITETSGNVAGDMAPFYPVLVPAVRRIFPQLLANEIVGVQPMSGPTGYAYAIRYLYGSGASVTGADLLRGDSANALGFKSMAVVVVPGVNGTPGTSADNFGPIVAGTPVAITKWDGVDSFDAYAGTAVYGEKGKFLYNLNGAAALAVGDEVTIGGKSYKVAYTIGNEAGFNVIFENYSGSVTTAAGEVLGSDGTTNEMKSMKMHLERVSTEAKTRKLKAEYTMELAQDLKNVHGLDAEGELINILEYEITAEIDRELVSRINNVATSGLAPWVYAMSASTITSGTNISDGRWEQEKFRTLYTRIVKEANNVALTTRRGAANFIVASTNVVTALEMLPSFMYSAVPGTIQAGAGSVKVGTLDGRFTVYCDTFAMFDYVTVGYKGGSSFDTGIIYCPYIPLMIQKVVDPNTFQPKVGFMQRSAIVENLYGAKNYYRTFLVDFTGSTLAGKSLF